MSHTLVKTIKMPLREPTNRKRRRIEKCMKETQKIKDKVSHLYWSVPKYSWDYSNKPVWFLIVNRHCNHHLPNHSAQEAGYTVRESLASFRSNRYGNGTNKKPRFEKANIVYFQGDQMKSGDNISRWYDSPKEGNYAVCLPLNKDANNDNCGGWGTREWFPLYIGDYQADFLDKILAEGIDVGSAKLIKKDGRYELHQTVKEEIELVENPKYIVGLDVGRNNLAAVAVLDRNGKKVTALPPWKTKYLEEKKREKERLRTTLQEDGHDVTDLSFRERRWLEQKCHEISCEVVKKLEERLDGSFGMAIEDLHGITSNLLEKVKSPKQRALINSWPFAKFQDMMEYKVLESQHTEVEAVNAHYTSQICSECGHRAESNRNGNDFNCQTCSHEGHADIEGAFNIARRGLSAFKT